MANLPTNQLTNYLTDQINDYDSKLPVPNFQGHPEGGSYQVAGRGVGEGGASPSDGQRACYVPD